MRTDQFIGLTKKAQEFVKDLEELPNARKILEGAFGNNFELGAWEMPSKENSPVEEYIIREILQASPWSSGPMFFTCLEVDFQNGARIQIYQWIDVLNYYGPEFDREKGEKCV